MSQGFFQPLHLLIVFIVLLIFGPLTLPELGERLAKGIREFVKSMSSGKMVVVPEKEEDDKS